MFHVLLEPYQKPLGMLKYFSLQLKRGPPKKKNMGGPFTSVHVTLQQNSDQKPLEVSHPCWSPILDGAKKTLHDAPPFTWSASRNLGRFEASMNWAVGKGVTGGNSCLLGSQNISILVIGDHLAKVEPCDHPIYTHPLQSKWTNNREKNSSLFIGAVGFHLLCRFHRQSVATSMPWDRPDVASECE